MTPAFPGMSLAVLVLVGVGMPALLLAVLGVASLLNRPLSERWTGRLAGSAMTISCAVLIVAFVAFGVAQQGTRMISYGAWSASHEGGIAMRDTASSAAATMLRGK